MTGNGKATEKKRVNIALQGGGSHGAFTWGVLDRLLEDGRLELAAVSGTSAGAMNAVALADGWVRGGAEGARERLVRILESGRPQGPLQPGAALALGHAARQLVDRELARLSVVRCHVAGVLALYGQPVQLQSAARGGRAGNPLRQRPLAATPSSCSSRPPTSRPASSGCSASEEINADVVMASACLPHIFQAVTIDGVPYWDGGYGGNPAIYPFYYANEVEDVLLVQVNPVMREGTPHSVAEIQNRIDEITFNATLLSEFRAISFVRELIASSKLSHKEFRDIRMHRIDADEAFKDLSASSKVNAEWAFLEYLRDLGRTAAEDWLADHFDAVGRQADARPFRGTAGEAATQRFGPHGHARPPIPRHEAEAGGCCPSALKRERDHRDKPARALALRVGCRDPRLHAFEAVEQQVGKRAGGEAARGEVDLVARRLGGDRRAEGLAAARRARPRRDRRPGCSSCRGSRRHAANSVIVFIMAISEHSIAAIMRSANGPSAASAARPASRRCVEQHRADGAIDLRLVLEQQVERRPRHLGGARDVVHRHARIAIGEEHLHGAIEDAGALGVWSGLRCGGHFSRTRSNCCIDKMTKFVKMYRSRHSPATRAVRVAMDDNMRVSPCA